MFFFCLFGFFWTNNKYSLYFRSYIYIYIENMSGNLEISPNDVSCVVWAIGECFFILLRFFLLIKIIFFHIGHIYEMTMRTGMGGQ